MQCPRCNSTEIISKNKGWNAFDSFLGFSFFGFLGLSAGGTECGHTIIRCESCGYKEEFDSEGNYKPSAIVQICQGVVRGLIAVLALPFGVVVFILCITAADKALSFLGVIK